MFRACSSPISMVSLQTLACSCSSIEVGDDDALWGQHKNRLRRDRLDAHEHYAAQHMRTHLNLFHSFILKLLKFSMPHSREVLLMGKGSVHLTSSLRKLIM
jgi:hypothetical protein